MIELKPKRIICGVYYLSLPEDQKSDEKNYIEVRKKEGRIYSDDELRFLPGIDPSHKLKYEWEVRKKTMGRIVKHFSKGKKQTVLEIGCGNGWLANAISVKTGNSLIALDVNRFELRQGVEVFKNNDRLKFAYGNIFENIFPPEIFESAILASAIQYFRDLNQLIERIFYFLKPAGKIYIVDSNFYTDYKVFAAEIRTQNYYKNLGFPEMSDFYYHHRWGELSKFDYTIQNKFSAVVSNITGKITGKGKTVFPFVIIRKN